MLKNHSSPKEKSTSWNHVADWYDEMLEEGQDTYQAKVILPNLLRLMEIQKDQAILDLACGQGFFARAFARAGAVVVGIDISPELIRKARVRTMAEQVANIVYEIGSAEKLTTVKNTTMDAIVLVLALQNIEQVQAVLGESSRVLKNGGKLFIVMTHPAFRMPQASSWGWDEEKSVQYRRLDAYLSETRVKIDMHPGEKQRLHTMSFHRPLQFYVKSLAKAGFAVTRLEEWNSYRHGPKGRKFAASERARKEIPLFLFIEACKP